MHSPVAVAALESFAETRGSAATKTARTCSSTDCSRRSSPIIAHRRGLDGGQRHQHRFLDDALPAVSSAAFVTIAAGMTRGHGRRHPHAPDPEPAHRRDGGHRRRARGRRRQRHLGLGVARRASSLGLALMLPGHLLGATGAGDVKLMAAVGAIARSGAGRDRLPLHRARRRRAGRRGRGAAAAPARPRSPGTGRLVAAPAGPRQHPVRRRITALRLRAGHRHRLRAGRVHWIARQSRR